MEQTILDLINKSNENGSITADVWVDCGEIQTENADVYWLIFKFLDLLGIDFTSGEPEEEEEGGLYYIYFD